MSSCLISENVFGLFPFLAKVVIRNSSVCTPVYKVGLPGDPSFTRTLLHHHSPCALLRLPFFPVPLWFPSLCLMFRSPTEVSVSAHHFFLRQHHFCLRFSDVLQQETLVWASGLTVKLWCWGREDFHAQRVLVLVEKAPWPSSLPSRSVVSGSLQPHGLQPTRLLCPGDSPGQSTRVGCHALLQGIFPTRELNPGLPHCRTILYHLSQRNGSPNWRGVERRP